MNSWEHLRVESYGRIPRREGEGMRRSGPQACETGSELSRPERRKVHHQPVASIPIISDTVDT